MNTHRRRFEKEKKRERARRVERHRRFEAGRCGELMMEAEIAWKLEDLEGCQELLERVLQARPNFVEALEWAAQTCFRRGRSEEGLAYYARLRESPGWPPLTVLAAAAAWKLARIGQCGELLAEFLSETSRRKEFPEAWESARSLAKDVRRTNGFSHLETAPAPKKPAPPERPDAVIQAATISHPSLPIVDPIPIPAPELPSFPKLPVPDIEIRFEFDGTGLKQTSVTPAAEIFLRRDYALLRLQKGFDELLSLGAVNNLEHFWYQLETARRVLRDFRGRALLADEVGLGKTIEAALALKEYAMRGLVKKTLILTPPSLVTQWLDELRSKFGLGAVSPETGGYGRDPEKFWLRHDVVVASLALARQPSNRERLAKIDYDMVIVDEAHYLKNRTTSTWQLVNELKKRFLLLLSATPVGNNLSELYNLILLLRPGLLGTEAQFRRDYGVARRPGGLASAGGLNDPARREKLRGLLREYARPHRSQASAPPCGNRKGETRSRGGGSP